MVQALLIRAMTATLAAPGMPDPAPERSLPGVSFASWVAADRAASAGKLPHCIVEESTQHLGLPNDSDEVVPSMFDDRSVLDELTEHDKVLVRLLYDSRLPAGMARVDALVAARRILREQGF